MSVRSRFALAALLALSLAIGAAASPVSSSPASDKSVAVIRLQGEVNDYSRDVLFRHFRRAETAGAKTVILEIDTYGGTVPSALDISRFLRGQTEIHTIAFVDNKAISAGALIAVACDEIVMSPGAEMGDRAPIIFDHGGSLKPLPPAERAKEESPVLNDFEDSARRNGYSTLVVDAMVRVEATVYLIANAEGHEKIVDEAEYKKLIANGEWKDASGITNPIDGPDRLLTVGPDIAHRLGLSKSIAKNAQDLAGERKLNIIADLRPGIGDHIVEGLNGGFARFVLMVVFMLSLYICLHAPGHGAAEAVAVVSLGLLAGIPMLTGYAQWWELGLIFAGLALCAFELLVFPGHGLSLGVGLIMVVFGLLMTFVAKDAGPGWFPTSHQAWHQMRGGLTVMVGAALVSLLGAAVLRPFLPKLPIFRKFILTETTNGKVQMPVAPLMAGQDVWPFVGTIGVAKTDLKPGGLVEFPYANDTRSAPVVSVSGFTSEGAKVIVQEARGNRIVVRAV